MFGFSHRLLSHIVPWCGTERGPFSLSLRLRSRASRGDVEAVGSGRVGATGSLEEDNVADRAAD